MWHSFESLHLLAGDFLILTLVNSVFSYIVKLGFIVYDCATLCSNLIAFCCDTNIVALNSKTQSVPLQKELQDWPKIQCEMT